MDNSNSGSNLPSNNTNNNQNPQMENTNQTISPKALSTASKAERAIDTVESGEQPIMSEKEFNEQREHAASQDVAHSVGKGAATYFGGAAGNKLYDVASNTKLGKAIESQAGKALEKNPATKLLLKPLSESGLTDVANQAIDGVAASGGAGGNSGTGGNISNASNVPSSTGDLTSSANPQQSGFNKFKNSVSNTGGKLASKADNIRNNRLSSINNRLNNAEDLSDDEIDALEHEKEKLETQQNRVENIKKTKRTIETIGKLFIKYPFLPYALIMGLVILILFLVIVYFMVSDTDFVGAGITSYDEAEYVSGYCTDIYLVREDDDFDGDPVHSIDEVNLEEKWDKDKDANHTKEADRWTYVPYNIDDYVKHVLNAEAIDVGDEKTFEVAAMMARTYALQITSTSCLTFDNTNKREEYRNPQAFSDDTSNAEISEAVSKTAGVIITINDALYDMSNYGYYDYFCHVDPYKNRNGDIEIYYTLQENKEERLSIISEWVDENIPTSCHTTTGSCFDISGKFNGGIYNNQCQANGLSLFGAKYLLNRADEKYSPFRTVEYYLDYGIKFKKMNTPGIIGGGGSCFIWPTDGTRITSSFGPRKAPTAGASTNHGAIDIGVPEGTNVYATNSGKVLKAGAATGFGYAVYIDHGNGIVSKYGHLKAGGIKVSAGQTVEAGQVIALSGNTGVSTGPHLHFQIELNGVKVDPLDYVDPNDPKAQNCVPQGGVVDIGDNAKSVCLSLKNNGFSNEAIAGMMTNIESESGFNPNAFNSSGGGQGAYGICQWRGGRQSALKSLANYQTISTQISYMLSELNGSYKAAYSAMRSTSSANDATYQWCLLYEVPGRTTQEAATNCQKRVNAKTGSIASYYSLAQSNCQ